MPTVAFNERFVKPIINPVSFQGHDTSVSSKDRRIVIETSLQARLFPVLMGIFHGPNITDGMELFAYSRERPAVLEDSRLDPCGKLRMSYEIDDTDGGHCFFQFQKHTPFLG